MLHTILFILFGLILGALALMGVLDSVRGTPVHVVRALDGDSVPGVGDAGFRPTMELLSRTPLATGHRIEMFHNGDETYPRLWDDLRGARHSITLLMYYCNAGRMATTLQEILVERARAGVQVLFLYDAFGSSFNKQYVATLREAGVQTSRFRPLSILSLHKAQHRSHARVVVIDGTIGYTGGFGIDDKWFGNGRTKGQWRDTNTRFTGPGVAQLQAAFVACWAESTNELLTGELLFPVTTSPPDESGAVAGVLHASPSIGSTEAERFVTFSIAAARKTLYITNSYFVPDGDIRRMIAAAARRGVDTRVLTTSAESDVKSTWYAGRARYEELLAAGVRIFEYQPSMLHAKTIIVDGMWGTIGSMNADNRSLSFNEESTIQVLDADVGARLDALFLEDLRHSEEIHLESFRRRPWTARVMEHAAHMVWRVL